MIPQIDNSLDAQVLQLISYPNLTYKYSEFQISGKVDDLEAIEQSIYHILSVKRYAYLIYDDNYGVELEQYIGQDLEFLEATIEDTLREALTQDDRITDVKVTNISTSYQDQQMVDKTKIQKVIETETTQEDIVTEENLDNLVTNFSTALLNSSITKVLVANVEFDVYCRQGVIHTEVNVNV